MNIQLLFLQKAIKEKNYISFKYKNKSYNKIKPIKLENENILYTNSGKFEFSNISKFIVLKERF